MITGSVDEDFVKYLRRGAVDFLHKPVSADKVLAAIRRAMLLEPTLDIAFAEPVEQNSKLLLENAQLKHHVLELEQRLEERGMRKADRERAEANVKRLEAENAHLRTELAALNEIASKRLQLGLLFSLAIKSLYAVLAVGLGYVLVQFAGLPKGPSVGVIFILVLLILLLPLDRVTRFSAKALKSEAHLEMPHKE
jgi:hypothetical protein